MRAAVDKLMVRRLAAEDAAAVMELCGQLGYPGTIEELRGRLETMARSEGRVGFAATLEAELVGWIDAAVERHLQAEDTVVIGGLVVRETARGVGVGQAALRRGGAVGARAGVGSRAGAVADQARGCPPVLCARWVSAGENIAGV
jgi:GNAT superfamily N-acetyltransferase